MASSSLKPSDSFDSAESSNSFDSADAIDLLESFSNFNPASAEKKICRFIQKEVQKSGAGGVILGLSGGIDSALVAALSSKALGPKSVCTVFFYTAENKDKEKTAFESADFKDALNLSASLSVSFQKINLHPPFKSAQKTLALTDSASPILSGNLASRLRMALLYFYANQ